ncbi:MAG: carboxypeptidase regulatory-like domain-containing protein [Bryobacteraceae bacterium]
MRQLTGACVVVLSVVSVAAQERLGSITGTVVDAGGASIPNVAVAVVDPVPLSTVADAAGKFVLAGLAPGVYNLRMQQLGFWTKDLTVRVESATETSLDRVVLEVQVPPCLGSLRTPSISDRKLAVDGQPHISGSARGEADGALERLTVTLFEAGTSRVIATTHTGENGEFLFGDLKPGMYDVAVSFLAGTFLGEETFAKVPKLRLRKDHELEVRLTWEQPPGLLCL